MCLVVSLLITIPVESAGKIKIAVVNLNSEGVSANISMAVTNFLALELVNTKKFDVMDRKNMEVILKEQAFQQTGCTSLDCAVEIGKILNVQKVIVGSINKLGREFHVSISIVDVESTKIEVGERAKCYSEEKLESVARELATKISENVILVAKVVNINEDKITINLGKVDGLKIGEYFIIQRLGEKIIDPDTGDVITQKKDEIATAEIVSFIGENVSEAKIVNEIKKPEVGDIVSQLTEEKKAKLLPHFKVEIDLGMGWLQVSEVSKYEITDVIKIPGYAHYYMPEFRVYEKGWIGHGLSFGIGIGALINVSGVDVGESSLVSPNAVGFGGLYVRGYLKTSLAPKEDPEMGDWLGIEFSGGTVFISKPTGISLFGISFVSDISKHFSVSAGVSYATPVEQLLSRTKVRIGGVFFDIFILRYYFKR